MTNTATRLISLILLLQSKPNRKAAELAAELGVSVRTVHRYFEMLDELGIPLYSERGPNGGFSLVRGYKMPPLILSPDEAVAVGLGATLVEEMWGTLYQDAARGALAKLENLLPEDQRSEIAWARRSLVTAGLRRAELGSIQDTLGTLRQALRRDPQGLPDLRSTQPHRAHLPGVRSLRAGLPLGALVRNRVLPSAPCAQGAACGPHPRGDNAG